MRQSDRVKLHVDPYCTPYAHGELTTPSRRSEWGRLLLLCNVGDSWRWPVRRTVCPLITASRANAHTSELLDEHRFRGKSWAKESGSARMRLCHAPA